MSLVIPSDVRARVQTSLSDTNLQAIIDQEEFEVVKRFGDHYVDDKTTITEVMDGEFKRNLYLRRAVTSVTEVKETNALTLSGVPLSAGIELENMTTLTTSGYRVWGMEGRIERLPRGSIWGDVVQVTYVPFNDNATRKAIIIELVRIALNRTAMKSESVGGEYSYTAADNWETERNRVLRRLSMSDV